MEFLLQNQNPNQKPDPIWWGQKPDPDPDHLLKNGTSSGYSMVPSQTWPRKGHFFYLKLSHTLLYRLFYITELYLAITIRWHQYKNATFFNYTFSYYFYYTFSLLYFTIYFILPNFTSPSLRRWHQSKKQKRVFTNHVLSPLVHEVCLVPSALCSYNHMLVMVMPYQELIYLIKSHVVPWWVFQSL